MAAKRSHGKRKRRRRARAEEDVREAAPSSPGGPPVVGMVSLGCAKNNVDSERVLGMLADRGFPVAADPADADVVLVNTCAFIGPAREETEEMLRSLAAEFAGSKPVVAIGCYAERIRDRLGDTAARKGTEGEDANAPRPALATGGGTPAFTCDSFREVAAFVPFDAYGELPAICSALVEGRQGRSPCPPLLRPEVPSFDEEPRLQIGRAATAYLKVAEGCSNRCSYCAVPAIRGGLRSFEIEKLVDEAARLSELGARELCVIAQDTAAYGIDLYGKPRLAELVDRLCEVKKLRWVRLLYVHPAHLTDEILDVVAGEEKVVRYLDLPCQHASSRVLEAMGRRHDGPFLRALVDRVRERVPGVTLRTSIIVGFPGETEAEFRELLAFVREVEFDHLGAFCYSSEEGTPAAELPGRVAARTARARRSRLMRAQQRIAFATLDARVGGVETAMLCHVLPAAPSDFGELSRAVQSRAPVSPAASAGSGGPASQPSHMAMWLARTEREAPEVDGHVLVDGPARGGASPPMWRPGGLVEVRIVARADYDLVARPEEERS